MCQKGQNFKLGTSAGTAEGFNTHPKSPRCAAMAETYCYLCATEYCYGQKTGVQVIGAHKYLFFKYTGVGEPAIAGCNPKDRLSLSRSTLLPKWGICSPAPCAAKLCVPAAGPPTDWTPPWADSAH